MFFVPLFAEQAPSACDAASVLATTSADRFNDFVCSIFETRELAYTTRYVGRHRSRRKRGKSFRTPCRPTSPTENSESQWRVVVRATATCRASWLTRDTRARGQKCSDHTCGRIYRAAGRDPVRVLVPTWTLTRASRLLARGAGGAISNTGQPDTRARPECPATTRNRRVSAACTRLPLLLQKDDLAASPLFLCLQHERIGD